MSEAIAAWHSDHIHFAWLLDVLEIQVLAFRSDERPNLGLMLDIAYYLRNFPDRYHHTREDVVFAKLIERDPGLRPLVERLRQEHRVIASAGDELLKRLNQVVDEIVVPRATVEAAAATYLEYYRQHIATEEEMIMPRAERLLTAEDWAAAEAAVPAEPDPLFGRGADDRYVELRRQIIVAAGRA
jgi:hemerythrin-like domain-containing protein